MHSIDSIAALAADGLKAVSSQLPWGWFLLMAAVDLGLIAVVVHRRARGRRDGDAPRWVDPGRPVMVLRNGWLVPRSRTLALSPHPASYAWPLHREYPVRRIA